MALGARETGGSRAGVLGGAVRLAAYRGPRRRAAALLRGLLGELLRGGHDPGDDTVRSDQLRRRQSEAHLSLGGSGLSPGGSGLSRGMKVDRAARMALRPAPR